MVINLSVSKKGVPGFKEAIKNFVLKIFVKLFVIIYLFMYMENKWPLKLTIDISQPIHRLKVKK
jgi:hypothetical protein